jgi:recombination protein U
MKNMGKVFEDSFRDSIPSEVFFKRFKDDMSKYRNVFNTCDFLLFNKRSLFLFELKSVQEDMIPFVKLGEQHTDGVTYKRLEKLFTEGQCRDVYAGFLIEFRKSGIVVYLTADQVIDVVLGGWFERKSIPLAWAERNGLRIPRELMRTRYKYPVKNILDWVVEYHARLGRWGAEAFEDSSTGN